MRRAFCNKYFRLQRQIEYNELKGIALVRKYSTFSSKFLVLIRDDKSYKNSAVVYSNSNSFSQAYLTQSDLVLIKHLANWRAHWRNGKSITNNFLEIWRNLTHNKSIGSTYYCNAPYWPHAQSCSHICVCAWLHTCVDMYVRLFHRLVCASRVYSSLYILPPSHFCHYQLQTASKTKICVKSMKIQIFHNFYRPRT